MPIAPLKPCLSPGCPALTDKGRCPAHAKAASLAYERNRGSASARGYGHRWSQYTIKFKQAHPLCVRCLPNLTPMQCVDHIIPVQGADDPLFWEPTNHQPLCNSCHSIKTQEDVANGLQRAPQIYRVT